MGGVIGILALQGAAAAHKRAITNLGLQHRYVRSVADLQECAALILPGGESTTISKLLDSTRLREPIAARLAGGMPTLGTCAGLILLAREVRDAARDGHPQSFAQLDIAVLRNGFGRQQESFEGEVLDSQREISFPAVFIRAPRIIEVGAEVQVRAKYGAEPVWVSAGAVHGVSFHPELTDDLTVHTTFVEEAL